MADHHDSHSILHHRRLHRFREVATGIFGLVVVLGAFALTEIPLQRTEDIANALCYFAPLFFFIVMLWTQVGELLDLHPSNDRHAERTITLVLFFATLVPVGVKLGAASDKALGGVAFDVFPIMISIVFGLMAYSSHRLLGQRGNHLHPEDAEQLLTMRNRDLLLVVIFLASLAIPPSAEIAHLSWEGIVWTSAFFLPIALLRTAAALRARSARIGYERASGSASRSSH